jgi:endo-1,4-beta-D-glucanase Y
LNELPEARRAQAIANYERFFGMPTQEQSQALRKLTPQETAQMQQTLISFNHLSPEQRKEALAGFRKFSELTAVERAAFLQTAERWQAMSETDRENWRKMVTRLRSAGAIPPPLPTPGRKNPTPLVGQVK